MSKNLPTDVVRARVVAGGVDTPCYRAGRGGPVVLLADSPTLLATLLEWLPRCHRVVAPESSPPAARSLAELDDFPAWLRAFLDALGLQSVAVVAGPDFAAAALAFVLLEPERVTGVVFLQRGSCDESTPESEVSAHLSAGHPLLAAWIGAADEQGSRRAMPRILAFLATIEKRRIDLNGTDPIVR